VGIMKQADVSKSQWTHSVVFLSVLLLFFTVPHTLEDFATGEPTKAGVPAAVLAFVISTIFSLQALGLFWLGQNLRRGLFAHIGIGLFWPVASGLAQLPAILGTTPYRSGIISITYVGGMIVVGTLLCIVSLLSLRSNSKQSIKEIAT
jgi:hypothetical protein